MVGFIENNNTAYHKPVINTAIRWNNSPKPNLLYTSETQTVRPHRSVDVQHLQLILEQMIPHLHHSPSKPYVHSKATFLSLLGICWSSSFRNAIHIQVRGIVCKSFLPWLQECRWKPALSILIRDIPPA